MERTPGTNIPGTNIPAVPRPAVLEFHADTDVRPPDLAVEGDNGNGKPPDSGEETGRSLLLVVHPPDKKKPIICGRNRN
jgi:hypothetical protein